MEPQIVSVDGAEVATWVLGPDEPRGDLVLCHGTPWSSDVWRGVAERLACRWRVHLWDMPGYGRSSMQADVPVDLAPQMARFARLLEHRGLDRPAVVAHDVGGAVALGAHLLHGAEYERLVLWDVVTLDPWGSPFFRQIAALTPDDTRPVVERLGTVRCPVAVGWGEDDPWIPVEQAGRLADALPDDVPVVTLPGVGHLAPVEATDAVADAIEAWLG